MQPGTSFADGQFNNQTSILPPKIFLLLLCLFSWPYILKTIVQTERRCEAYTSFLQKMTWWHVQDNENIENFQYYHSSVRTVFSIEFIQTSRTPKRPKFTGIKLDTKLSSVSVTLKYFLFYCKIFLDRTFLRLVTGRKQNIASRDTKTYIMCNYLPNRSHSPFVIKLLISPPPSSWSCKSSWNKETQNPVNYRSNPSLFTRLNLINPTYRR